MVKPFVHKAIFDIIHVHPPETDYNEFFEKYIPRSHMPKDFSGDLPTITELHEKNIEAMLCMKEYFRLDELHTKKELDAIVNE